MLQVNIVSFSYDKREVLRDISFSLENGRHLAVLGESGGGKSTLLHLIYGLLDLNEGEISWNNKPILGPKYNLVPGEDYIKLVAQEFNIMPYTTVAENVATYLSRKDLNADEDRVRELLSVVELEDFAGEFVKNLSGGQKQRVAIAKALANSPELLLLDEPFSNIDTFRKNKLRRKLYGYLREKGISCITATHDSEETLSFADEILMIRNGRTEAKGNTMEIFNNLQNEYQAGFFGEVNILPSHLIATSSQHKVNFLLPHQLKVSSNATPLEVTIEQSYFKGSFYLIQACNDGRSLYFQNEQPLTKGDKVYLTTA